MCLGDCTFSGGNFAQIVVDYGDSLGESISMISGFTFADMNLNNGGNILLAGTAAVGYDNSQLGIYGNVFENNIVYGNIVSSSFEDSPTDPLGPGMNADVVGNAFYGNTCYQSCVLFNSAYLMFASQMVANFGIIVAVLDGFGSNAVFENQPSCFTSNIVSGDSLVYVDETVELMIVPEESYVSDTTFMDDGSAACSGVLQGGVCNVFTAPSCVESSFDDDFFSGDDIIGIDDSPIDDIVIDDTILGDDTVIFVTDAPTPSPTIAVTGTPVTTPTTEAPVTNPVSAAPVSIPTTEAPVTNPVSAAPVSIPITDAPLASPFAVPVASPTSPGSIFGPSLVVIAAIQLLAYII